MVEAKSPTPQPVKPVEAKAAQASPTQPKTRRLAEAKNPPLQSAREEPQTLVDDSRGLALAAAEPQAPSAPDSALAGAFSAVVSEQATSVDAAAGDEWFVGINGVPVGPIKLLELRSKAAAGAVTNASLVWRDGFEEWKPLGSFPELVAIVEEGTSSARSSVEPFIPPVESGPMPETVPRPMAVAPAVSTTISTAADEAADLELAGIKPRSGLSLAQIFAMVVAIMFGLTVGFVVFSGTEKTKEVVKYVEVPAKAQQSETDSASTPEPESETEQEPEKDEAKTGRKGGKAAKGGSVVAASQTKQEGLKGLSGLKGLKGPQNGPSGNQATESTAGRPLDSAAVQGTVRRYTGSVKRSCWQPALDTRDANAPTSARVSVAITVGATGSVQNVSTSGDPRGYRGLATCIARRVRGWQFPASSGTTTVNVPFVFAAQ